MVTKSSAAKTEIWMCMGHLLLTFQKEIIIKIKRKKKKKKKRKEN